MSLFLWTFPLEHHGATFVSDVFSIRSAFETPALLVWKVLSRPGCKVPEAHGQQSVVWQRIVAGGRLDHGAAGSLTYGAPATGGKSSSLEHSTLLHSNPNCSARQCNTSLYPALVYWSQKCRRRGEHTWHERKSLPRCSHPPSSGWGNSTKWVMRKSLRSQKFAQLPRSCQLKSTHCPCLLGYVRPPFSSSNKLSTTITTRRLLQALQPPDCMPRRRCWFQSTQHFLCRFIVLIEHLFWIAGQLQQQYNSRLQLTDNSIFDACIWEHIQRFPSITNATWWGQK